jgi:oxygen-independent coproporphyrinogen-3 oxidase
LNGEKVATRAHRAPEEWLKRVHENHHGAHPFETVDAQQRLQEMVMMGLRLQEGIPLERFKQELGQDLTGLIPEARLKPLIDANYLTLTPDRLAATPEGRIRLNALISAIFS